MDSPLEGPKQSAGHTFTGWGKAGAEKMISESRWIIGHLELRAIDLASRVFRIF